MLVPHIVGGSPVISRIIAHTRRASPRLASSGTRARNSSADSSVWRIAGLFLAAMPSYSHVAQRQARGRAHRASATGSGPPMSLTRGTGHKRQVSCRGAGLAARKGSIMGQPVVHFEIIGKDPARLRSYYGELFEWEFDTSSPVSETVSEPTNYGFVDRNTT